MVGAGPAGMECAVTLGRRGFEAVHLVEAEPDIGGRMRWVRRLPTLGDWGRIVDHRKVMLSKLRNVEMVTGRRLSAEDVRDYGAQLVVIATGSRWSGEGVQSSTHEPIDGASASLPHVLTPEQVMDGKRPPGRPRGRLRRRGIFRRTRDRGAPREMKGSRPISSRRSSRCRRSPT